MFWGTELSTLFSFQVSHGFHPSLTKRQYYFKQRSHNFLGRTIAQSLGRFTGVAIWSWHTPVPSSLNRSTWTNGGLTKIKRKVRKNAVSEDNLLLLRQRRQRLVIGCPNLQCDRPNHNQNPTRTMQGGKAIPELLHQQQAVALRIHVNSAGRRKWSQIGVYRHLQEWVRNVQLAFQAAARRMRSQGSHALRIGGSELRLRPRSATEAEQICTLILNQKTNH